MRHIGWIYSMTNDKHCINSTSGVHSGGDVICSGGRAMYRKAHLTLSCGQPERGSHLSALLACLFCFKEKKLRYCHHRCCCHCLFAITWRLIQTSVDVHLPCSCLALCLSFDYQSVVSCKRSYRGAVICKSLVEAISVINLVKLHSLSWASQQKTHLYLGEGVGGVCFVYVTHCDHVS